MISCFAEFLSHTDLTNLTKARIVSLACVGFAECIYPGGSGGEATRLREICEICVNQKSSAWGKLLNNQMVNSKLICKQSFVLRNAEHLALAHSDGEADDS